MKGKSMKGRKGFPVKRTCGALLLSTALALGLAGCGDSGNRNGGTNSGTNDSVYDGTTNGSVSGSSGTYGGGAWDGTGGVHDNDDVRDTLERAGDDARNAVDRAGDAIRDGVDDARDALRSDANR